MRTLWDGELHRCTSVDVLPADGMQEVRGSNPLSSTVQKRNSNTSNGVYSSKVRNAADTIYWPASPDQALLPVSAGRGQLGVKARVRRAAAQLGASWSAPPRRQARAKRVTAH